MRSKSFLIGCVLFFGLMLLVAGCKSEAPAGTTETGTPSENGGADNEAAQPSGNTGTRASGDEDIDIIGGVFVPDSVTVGAGSTVTWTNKDAEDHSVSFNEETVLDTVLDPGETVDATFDAPGIYKYKDKFSGARGEVIVE